MEFLELPGQYASVCGPLVYRLGGCDPDGEIRVEVVNSRSGAVVGAKRLRGQGEYAVDISAYAAGICLPSPASGTGFKACPERGAVVRVRAGGVVSPERLFTCAVRGVAAFSILSDGPSARAISWDEWDEIVVLAQAGPLTASYSFGGTEGDWHCSENAFAAEEGHVAMVVDMASLAVRMRAAGMSPEACDRLDVEVVAGNQTVARRSYGIVPSAPGRVRLMWLNRDGGVDAYTFCAVERQGVSAEKQLALGGDGGREVIGVDVLAETAVLSDFEPAATVDWLEGIAASSQVWVASADGPRSVAVSSAGRVGSGDVPRRVRVVFSQVGLW